MDAAEWNASSSTYKEHAASMFDWKPEKSRLGAYLEEETTTVLARNQRKQ